MLYPKGWQQPATYIRSSATVEDYVNPSYCMDEDDEVALKVMNSKLPGLPPMTEEQFEEVMSFFEEMVQLEQPFANVHNAPIMPLDELMLLVTDSTPDSVRTYANIVYEHWQTRRVVKGNNGISPQLKFETGQESDDADPYVCFRRREVKNFRKTRNRDLQSAEKLRKLRLELETARNVLLMVKQREQARKEVLEIDKQVFEQRQAFRELKRKLKQSGDDDLLINQKKPKLPPVVTQDQQLQQQLANAAVRPSGAELKTIEDLRAERERAIEREIQTNIEKHIRWNDAFIDKTMFPLTPDTEDFQDTDTQFLPAMPATVYLPTPPASVSEDEADKPAENGDVEMSDISRSSTPFRYASPAGDEDYHQAMPAFRMRIGRGGRRMLDRKVPYRRKDPSSDGGYNAFRFDYSDDDSDVVMDDESSHMDASTRRANERCLLLGKSSESQAANARRAQLEQVNAGHTPAQQSQLQVSTAAAAS